MSTNSRSSLAVFVSASVVILAVVVAVSVFGYFYWCCPNAAVCGRCQELTPGRVLFLSLIGVFAVGVLFLKALNRLGHKAPQRWSDEVYRQIQEKVGEAKSLMFRAPDDRQPDGRQAFCGVQFPTSHGKCW